jgi:hypothetical protein
VATLDCASVAVTVSDTDSLYVPESAGSEMNRARRI